MADVAIVGANVRFSAKARIEQVVAGAAITIGQSLFKDSNDLNKWKPAQATVAATAKVEALAACAANVDQALLICREDPDLTPGFVTAAGAAYYASATLGAIADAVPVASGSRTTFLMIGKTGNKAAFKPVYGPDPKP